MTLLRAIQLMNTYVLVAALFVTKFGRREVQKTAAVIWMISVMICWGFIILL